MRNIRLSNVALLLVAVLFVQDSRAQAEGAYGIRWYFRRMGQRWLPRQ